MENFTPVSALLGGALIGVAAAMFLVMNGRLAGVSGIVSRLFPPAKGDTDWRLFFVGGLILGTLVYQAVGTPYEIGYSGGWPILVIGGLWTGIGTRIGGGCTSGHGVCGMARMSSRSITATAIFMVFAGITVFLARHVVGVI